MTLDIRSLACVNRCVCVCVCVCVCEREKGGELIRPNYTGKFAVLGNINSSGYLCVPSSLRFYPLCMTTYPYPIFTHTTRMTHFLDSFS